MELWSECLLQLIMEIKSSGVHDLAFIWIENVTTSRFKVCFVQSGKNPEGNSTMIDWFAFQGSQSRVSHGKVRINLFTTGSQCKWVKFSQVRLTLKVNCY